MRREERKRKKKKQQSESVWRMGKKSAKSDDTYGALGVGVVAFGLFFATVGRGDGPSLISSKQKV
jgi:hypothetical protein